MFPLHLIVPGDAVVRPPVLGHKAGGLAFQHAPFAVWLLDEVIHIGDHKGVEGVLENLADGIDGIARLSLIDFRHQLLQAMAYLLGDPVGFIRLHRLHPGLFIEQLPPGFPGGDAQDRRHIAAADSFGALPEPFLLGELRDVLHQNSRIVIQV